MTRLTAIIIRTRGDEVKPLVSQHPKTKKWASMVSLFKGEEFDYVLLSTEHIYDTKKAAVEAGEKVIKEVRELESVF